MPNDEVGTDFGSVEEYEAAVSAAQEPSAAEAIEAAQRAQIEALAAETDRPAEQIIAELMAKGAR